MSIYYIKVGVWEPNYTYPPVSHRFFFLVIILLFLILLLHRVILQVIISQIKFICLVNFISMGSISWCLLIYRESHYKTSEVDFTTLKYWCVSRELFTIKFPLRKPKRFSSLKITETGMFGRTNFSNFNIPSWTKNMFGKNCIITF